MKLKCKAYETVIRNLDLDLIHRGDKKNIFHSLFPFAKMFYSPQ
jgi:hypothetical protein